MLGYLYTFIYTHKHLTHPNIITFIYTTQDLEKFQDLGHLYHCQWVVCHKMHPYHEPVASPKKQASKVRYDLGSYLHKMEKENILILSQGNLTFLTPPHIQKYPINIAWEVHHRGYWIKKHLCTLSKKRNTSNHTSFIFSILVTIVKML